MIKQNCNLRCAPAAPCVCSIPMMAVCGVRSYATSSLSAFVLRRVAAIAGVPLQVCARKSICIPVCTPYWIYGYVNCGRAAASARGALPRGRASAGAETPPCTALRARVPERRIS